MRPCLFCLILLVKPVLLPGPAPVINALGPVAEKQRITLAIAVSITDNNAMQETTRNSPDRRIPNLVLRSLTRILLFCLAWVVLTRSDPTSWIVGGPAVLLAAGLSLLLAPPSRWELSLTGAARFLLFFLHQSILGGVDVMRRALSPRPLVNPGLVSFATFLPAGAPRILLVNTISLLPGTLSADLKKDTVLIHTINKDLPIWSNIQNLEGRIAVLFKMESQGRA